jgi:putative addiction module killer protein
MIYQLKSTDTFNRWLATITGTVKNQLLSRLARLENGNFGDHKVISADLFELRCFFGGGLRMYYTLREGQIVLLLAGGNKSTQSRDITRAKVLLSEFKGEL